MHSQEPRTKLFTPYSSGVLSVNAGGDESTKDDDSAKIVFRKPVKRRSSEGEGALDASTSKKAKTDGSGHGGKPRTRRTSTSKAVKNSSLLSFGDDEEEL